MVEGRGGRRWRWGRVSGGHREPDTHICESPDLGGLITARLWWRGRVADGEQNLNLDGSEGGYYLEKFWVEVDCPSGF